MAANRVLLPEPLRPSRPVMAPGTMRALTRARALVAPKCTLRSSVCTAYGAGSGVKGEIAAGAVDVIMPSPRGVLRPPAQLRRLPRWSDVLRAPRAGGRVWLPRRGQVATRW